MKKTIRIRNKVPRGVSTIPYKNKELDREKAIKALEELAAFRNKEPEDDYIEVEI